MIKLPEDISIELSLVTPNPHGRQISDRDWESVELSHINTWKAAQKVLYKREYEFKNGRYLIKADWSQILKRHKRNFSAYRQIYDTSTSDEKRRKISFSRKPSVSTISVTIPKGNEIGLGTINAVKMLVESFLYDVFLITNLASPSCCNFYRAQIQYQKDSIDLSLSGSEFEIALLTYQEHGWPPIRNIPLEQVATWFSRIREGFRQIPDNPMEKALFAILHISKLELSPISIVWIFYAFESLLQTKVGENFGSIVSRLSLILEANEQQAKLVRRKMRDLYNLRSALVHGGLEILHPMRNEVLDRRVDDHYDRLMDATDFGYALLISAVQKIIEKGWSYPKFEEQLKGVT